jgi:plasmid stabilization system protein ParE
MAAELIIAPKAEEDLQEAYAWYERQRVGLGEDFLSSTLRNPEMHRVVHENSRRALIRRFPYALFYEYVNDHVIVLCVFHRSRDPEKWRQRLS